MINPCMLSAGDGVRRHLHGLGASPIEKFGLHVPDHSSDKSSIQFVPLSATCILLSYILQHGPATCCKRTFSFLHGV